MSGTLLEQTRGFHEEIERLERCIVQELQKETKSHKERLHQNHRVNNMRHAILDSTGKLVSLLFPLLLFLYGASLFLQISPMFSCVFVVIFRISFMAFNELMEGGVARIPLLAQLLLI